MNFIPSLQANYVPVPETFLRRAFSPEVTREELVVMLFLFSKTYGWNQEKGFLSLDDLVDGTGLTLEEATRGVTQALDQEFVLEMPLDASNPAAGAMYLLNTLENRRFLEAYATASQDGTPPPAPTSDPAPRARPGTAIGASWGPDPQPAAKAPPQEASEEAGLEAGSLDSPPDLEVVEEEIAQPGASLPAPEAPPPTDPEPEASDGALADWGFGPRTVEMIVRLLGRVPSKDERMRLQDLGATDGELIEAMGRLIEKQVSIYSSDLIVYEYEALKSAERRLNREAQRKQEAEDRQARQRDCRKCDGLGYFFVGVSGIQECECRNH